MNNRIIYINGRFLTQRITGVQRFALNLVLSLDKELDIIENSDAQFILLTPPLAVTDLKLKNIYRKQVGQRSGHFWEQIELPRFSRDGLLINLCNTGPAFKRNQFVNICDAAVFRFPEAYSKAFVLWYRILGFLNSKFSNKIITISEFSKAELIEVLGLKKENVSVITPAVNFIGYEQDDEILNKLRVREQSYFLAVGSLDRRKNFLGIVEAFINLKAENIELVIVGAEHNKVFSNQKIPSSDKIKWTGYLEDKQLISLYKNAVGFVYPSFYEGFGIPPLEAMSLGCAVIVSNVASLPEVCGNAALYCDPRNTTTIKDAMENLLLNPELVTELRDKGKTRAAKFSYLKSARKLLRIINGSIEI